MLIKRIKDLSEEQKEASITIWADFKHNNINYMLEIIACDVKLNSGSTHELYSTVAIYNTSNLPETMVYHEVFKQTLTEEQCIEAEKNILNNPSKYLQ